MTTITLFKANSLNEEFSFPTSWDDLLLEELVLIAEAYFLNKYSPAELLISILKIRIAEKIGNKKASEILVLIDVDDLAINYSELLAFIKESITLTKQPLNLPNAPVDDFEDIKVGTFEDADILFSQFMDGDESKLEEFYYTLFNTKNPTSKTNMLVAALYFIGCKNTLPALFPLVFPAPEESEIDTKKPVVDLLALTKLIHEFAGPKNGTRKDIRSTLLKEFLFECQLEAEKAPDVY